MVTTGRSAAPRKRVQKAGAARGRDRGRAPGGVAMHGGAPAAERKRGAAPAPPSAGSPPPSSGERARNVRARWRRERASSGPEDAEAAEGARGAAVRRRQRRRRPDPQRAAPVAAAAEAPAGRPAAAAAAATTTHRGAPAAPTVAREDLYIALDRYLRLRERLALQELAADDLEAAAASSADDGAGVPRRYRADAGGGGGDRERADAESRRCQRIVVRAFRPLIASAVRTNLQRLSQLSLSSTDLTAAAERGVIRALEALTREKFKRGRFEGYVPFFVRRSIYDEVAALLGTRRRGAVADRPARPDDGARRNLFFEEDYRSPTVDDDVGGRLGAGERDSEVEMQLFDSRMVEVLTSRQRAVVCRSLGLKGHDVLPGRDGGGAAGRAAADPEARVGLLRAGRAEPLEMPLISGIAEDFGYSTAYISKLHADGVRRIVDDRDGAEELLSALEGTGEQLRP